MSLKSSLTTESIHLNRNADSYYVNTELVDIGALELLSPSQKLSKSAPTILIPDSLNDSPLLITILIQARTRKKQCRTEIQKQKLLRQFSRLNTKNCICKDHFKGYRI